MELEIYTTTRRYSPITFMHLFPHSPFTPIEKRAAPSANYDNNNYAYG